MTLTLPRALAPWADELRIFAPEVGAGLGGLVLRLSTAIGAFRNAGGDSREEPDGFHDVARRGPYDRLLSSEWLLAEELPDEFLRRAISNEHLFLELAHERRVTRRATVALFDAGPFQLGAPRVAHVALLVVLARRAIAAGAAFSWGIIQDGTTTAFAGVTASTVLALLAAKTTARATPEMIDRWATRLDALAPATDRDVWIVGGPDAPALGRAIGASSATVDDVLEPGTRSVAVDVRRTNGAPSRHVVLDLPAPALVSRILRDPFAAAEPARATVPSEVDGSGSILLAPSGTVAFLRAGNDVASFPIPNSARAGLGRPKLVRGKGVIAAIGVHRRAKIFVEGDDATRTLSLSLGRGEVGQAGHFTTEARVHAPWMPSRSDPLRPLLVRTVRPGYRTPEVAYVDARGWLFVLEPEERPRLLARGVLATIAFEDGLGFLARDLANTWLKDAPKGCAFVTLGGGDEQRIEPLTAPDLMDARIARDMTSHGRRVTTAVLRNDTWLVRATSTGFETRVDPGAAVIGVVSTHATTLGLVVLRADRSAFDLIQGSEATALVSATATVLQATVSDRGNVLVFTTSAKELVLYSLDRREVVGRFDIGGAA